MFKKLKQFIKRRRKNRLERKIVKRFYNKNRYE